MDSYSYITAWRCGSAAQCKEFEVRRQAAMAGLEVVLLGIRWVLDEEYGARESSGCGICRDHLLARRWIRLDFDRVTGVPAFALTTPGGLRIMALRRAVSSAGERLTHIQEATGSIPVPPTTKEA